MEAPEATVRAVLRHIGVEAPERVAVGPPTLAKQADLGAAVEASLYEDPVPVA